MPLLSTHSVKCFTKFLVPALAALLVLPLQSVDAQVIPDSTRRDSSVITPVITVRDTVVRARRRSALVRPPLAPGRAFLMSFAIPGWAQSRLERSTSGALFAGAELASIAMLRRSMNDVRAVRALSRDTVAGDFTVTPGTGAVTPGERVLPAYDEALERTRKLHVEDWIAAIAFNHLISAADAFVSAQLWDVPARVTMVPTRQGMMLTATLRF